MLPRQRKMPPAWPACTHAPFVLLLGVNVGSSRSLLATRFANNRLLLLLLLLLVVTAAALGCRSCSWVGAAAAARIATSRAERAATRLLLLDASPCRPVCGQAKHTDTHGTSKVGMLPCRQSRHACGLLSSRYLPRGAGRVRSELTCGWTTAAPRAHLLRGLLAVGLRGGHHGTSTPRLGRHCLARRC
jgi:hypothetical protein